MSLTFLKPRYPAVSDPLLTKVVGLSNTLMWQYPNADLIIRSRSSFRRLARRASWYVFVLGGASLSSCWVVQVRFLTGPALAGSLLFFSLGAWWGQWQVILRLAGTPEFEWIGLLLNEFRNRFWDMEKENAWFQQWLKEAAERWI
jgi:hypothetical protein